eukprot:gnl/TRDRNA2_/TRDRNA2_174230_c0_seq3.p1 gnl/TRDRNA2_/TRDRNA2_174230_c0~~gnl/TRDRNA2_/TRDRNA2_174230_c0_seq3.p1  ORF type:complete len:494 (-),score=86.94 gnl/TRDRNA2_/TRDRNA2_174230_c0_seq3:73-1554(-)
MGVERAVAKYSAEALGTFLLVFTVGCNVVKGQPNWAPLSIAAVLMVSIYALGGVSGANFNPAVSLSLGLLGKLGWKDVGIYIVVQLVAGILAGFAYFLMLGEVFNLEPAKGFNWWSAALVEILFTFMLCFVVLNVACSKAHGGKDQFYGFAIGFVYVAGGYGAGHISGGCFNPAIAFGIDVSSAIQKGFGWCIVYTGFELVGVLLAAGIYRIIRPEDFVEDDLDAPDDIPAAPPLYSRLCSEFLGSYMIVLTVGLNILGGSPGAAFSVAAALMCMVFALGSCSGAHFNPAVTISIMCAGRDICPAPDGAAYIAVQIAGGVCGASTYMFMEKGKTFPLGPGKGYGWPEAMTAELVFTFILCYVVLAVATTRRSLVQYFGLAIGSCFTIGGYAVGAVSGGALNPAISVGVSTAHLANNGGSVFWHCGAYAAAELLGGILAACAFMVTHQSEYKDVIDDESERNSEDYYEKVDDEAQHLPSAQRARLDRPGHFSSP